MARSTVRGSKKDHKSSSSRASSLPDVDLTDPSFFISQHVKTRQPGIIRSLPSDLLPLTRYANTSTLRKAASDAIVLVEPRDEKKGQHGTAVKRERMTFGEFLDRLKGDQGSNLYLTTQYDEETEGTDGDGEDDLEEVTGVEGYEAEARGCFPEPIRSILQSAGTGRVPLKPTVASSLVLQQMNIWIGRSASGSSSGLHHDYHDNLYVLLKGRKRFVFYPPDRAKYLSPHGVVHKVHKNGLIVYEGYEGTGADGLDAVDRARWRMKALEREIEICRVKMEAGAKEVKKRLKKLEEEYDQAVEEHLGMMMEDQGGGDGVDDFDGLDDFDNLDELDELDKPAYTKGAKRNATSSFNEQGEPNKRSKLDDTPREPDSFSKISSAQLHAHLDLPLLSPSLSHTLPTIPPIPPKRRAKLEKAGKPLIVDLKAGEMLYLPASWWHEVTSYGASPQRTGSDACAAGRGDDTHIAFNFWFHPPSDLDEASSGLYKDKRVWRYIDEEVSKEYGRLVGVPST